MVLLQRVPRLVLLAGGLSFCGPGLSNVGLVAVKEATLAYPAYFPSGSRLRERRKAL